MSKTILITGASRGFGKIWAEAFLKRGDKVVATARNTDTLSELVETYGDAVLALQLDVNNRSESFDVIDKAFNHFGVIDVIINNAGYGLFGAVEETSEKDVRDQFETNVFGTLWMNQAVIPKMREQGHGHIIQVSSFLGLATAPLFGIYSASKWAVEGMIEAMSQEIKDFGIATTLIEPIAYDTDFSTSSGVQSKNIDAYADLRTSAYKRIEGMSFGKPEATAAVVLKIVDAEQPPARILFGESALTSLKHIYGERMSEWEQWSELSVEAQG